MDKKLEPKVEIAKDGLSASLTLPEEFDRSKLSIDSCISLLQHEGVIEAAIDRDIMSAGIDRAKAAEPGQFEVIIAKATTAVDGTDAYIEWLVDQAEATQDQAEEQTQDTTESIDDQETGNESACYYSQSIFTIVKTGDLLGKIHTETLGTEGKDLYGKVLAQRAGQPLDFLFDETIVADTAQNIVAQTDGVLMRDEKTAHISDTIEVEGNVDFSTGNIDFPGNVVVSQGVKDCFTVKARGDIQVHGLIEAAALIAGKDLHANSGFAGREQGDAKVAGNLYAKYLDAAQVHVAGDLCVEREVINCATTVLGDINCPNGSIISGRTDVAGAAELMNLGASAHPVTELHVGVLPVIDPLIEKLSTLINQLIEERDKQFDEQEIIIKNSGSRIQPGMQGRLDEITKAMGELQLRLDRAMPTLHEAKEHAESIRKIDVRINRIVHPNTLIVCGDYHYRITNEIKGPLRITCNKRGQLEYQRGEDKPKLLSGESELKGAA